MKIMLATQFFLGAASDPGSVFNIEADNFLLLA